MNVSALKTPHAQPPEPGGWLEVAPGVLWIRLALPMRLDHVNCYALEDDDGWAIVDAGITNEPTRAAWEALLAGPLSGKPVRRLIITHNHPDHVGAAGWLMERTGAELIMTREEFLLSLLRCRGMGEAANRAQVEFFRRHGLSESVLRHIAEREANFAVGVSFLPAEARILRSGDGIRLAGRDWQVLSGEGHSPAQLLLYAPDDRLFLGADQVLGTITPNIPVTFTEPEGDPLSEFLASLRSLKPAVAPDSLVLPGHKLPFFGLHERIDALIAHHEDSLERIVGLCREAPLQVPDLIGHLFRPGLSEGGLALAASEVLAHLMTLRNTGRILEQPGGDGQVFWSAKL